MAKKTPQNKAIVNRRARYDYTLGDELRVGIQLTGQEVRAARDGHVQLRGAFVTVRGEELWLNNASFSLKLNERGGQERTIDTRPRKLLAHRREIDACMHAVKAEGRTIVPLKLLTEGTFIKLIIAVGQGKKRHDKRETIKRRDQERDVKRELKKW